MDFHSPLANPQLRFPTVASLKSPAPELRHGTLLMQSNKSKRETEKRIILKIRKLMVHPLHVIIYMWLHGLWGHHRLGCWVTATEVHERPYSEPLCCLLWLHISHFISPQHHITVLPEGSESRAHSLKVTRGGGVFSLVAHRLSWAAQFLQLVCCRVSSGVIFAFHRFCWILQKIRALHTLKTITACSGYKAMDFATFLLKYIMNFGHVPSPLAFPVSLALFH